MPCHTIPYHACRLPEKDRRGYKGVFHALTRIVKEEGVLNLWRVGYAFDMVWYGMLTSIGMYANSDASDDIERSTTCNLLTSKGRYKTAM